MLVPNESIAGLAELTSLPGDWVREWAAGRGPAMPCGGPVRGWRPAVMLEFCVNKVDLDTLPWSGPGARSPAF